MKRLSLIFLMALCIFVMSFAVGCGGNKELEKLDDFHIKVSDSSYDFTAALSVEDDKEAYKIDTSAVDFDTAGAYDVKITYRKKSTTVKCYVYGIPTVEGTPTAVTYAQAVSGDITAGVSGKDSFNNALDVTVETGVKKDALGRIAYGENEVAYKVIDKAGNTATVTKKITVNETGRVTYSDMSVDIADGNVAVNLGDYKDIESVAVGGTKLESTDYSAKNGVLILYDRYLYTLEYGNKQTVTVVDKNSGWSEFGITVEDAKPLNYTAPVGKRFVFPKGKVELPSVKLANALQQCEIEYKLLTGSTPVQLEDGNVLSDAAIGEYTYSVKITRNKTELYNKTFTVSVVAKEEYDNIIFSADSDQFMNNLYTDTEIAEEERSAWEYNVPDFAGEWTDANGVKKSAARFNKISSDVNHSRHLYVVSEAVDRMLATGAKTLTIEFCAVTPDETAPQLRSLINDKEGNGDQWTPVNNNEWTSVLVDVSKLQNLYKEGIDGLFYGLRFVYTPGEGEKPFKVYIASIKADLLYQGTATFTGTYANGAETVEIKPDSTAVTGDITYDVTVTDDYAIRLIKDGATEHIGVIDRGMLVLDGKFYAVASAPGYNVLAGETALPDFAGSFGAAGYNVAYFTVSDGEETKLESLSGTYTAGAAVKLRAKISDGTNLLGSSDRNISVLNEYDYYSQNLATAANADKFSKSAANSIYAVSHTDKNGTTKDGLRFINTYSDNSNNYVFILDKEFIQGAIAAGFGGITYDWNISDKPNELRLGEWLVTDGWKWSEPLAWNNASDRWNNDNQWETRADSDRGIDTIAGTSTILIHMNAKGDFYIANMRLKKTAPSNAEYDNNFASEDLKYLWQCDSRNSITVAEYTDKNGVAKTGLYLHNVCYQNTDNSRTFNFGGAALVSKAKALGYTKIKFDICLVEKSECFGSPISASDNYYYGTTGPWNNDNAWETNKEIPLAFSESLFFTFTGENAYIANIRFVK